MCPGIHLKLAWYVTGRIIQTGEETHRLTHFGPKFKFYFHFFPNRRTLQFLKEICNPTNKKLSPYAATFREKQLFKCNTVELSAVLKDKRPISVFDLKRIEGCNFQNNEVGKCKNVKQSQEYRIPPNGSTPLFLDMLNMLCRELIFIFFI